MIRNSFILFPGIGPITEKTLWSNGILSWNDLINSSFLPTNIAAKRSEILFHIDEFEQRLNASDAEHFESRFPASEKWRMYNDFRDNAVFLDIETTGLDPKFNSITMVGLLDIHGYTPYMAGENLDAFPERIQTYDLIVTYNGSLFDLPYLEYQFGPIFRSKVHWDLRYTLKQLGYSGGLKAIEQIAQVGRPNELATLNGYDAILLWKQWLDGDGNARKTLIRYNAEDVSSLVELADMAYQQLRASNSFPKVEFTKWSREDVEKLQYEPEIVKNLAMKKPKFNS